MVALTVIVPVYGVEAYLAECLDSLLSYSGADLEVIAVDDASPDGSATILAGYAERDSRLRVLSLERNGGLGAARNTGLDHARGEYVWFVDADDWLPTGTPAAVIEAVAGRRPDVLIVDYARVFPDGTTEAYAAADLYPGDPLPDVFTLAERPALLRSLHIACNKVVRREFLVDVGIRFSAGWYEDVPFSIPLMLAADRLSDLHRVCYCYRQRVDGGSITRTVTDRHFEVFGQWERTFAFMDTASMSSVTPRPATSLDSNLVALRPVVFARMVWHLLAVLSKDDRVPRHLRRAYFAEMTRVYRRYLPLTGYPVPSRSALVTHRLIRLGAYRLYEGVHAAAKAARAVRRRIRPAGRAGVH
jgi:glycosyltransferase involved in cell wall biosynthesis